MTNLNSVLIEGNLTQDPQCQTIKSGATLCKFFLAVNRSYKVADEVREEVSFFPVEIWGERAEPCVSYLKKGKKVRVIGRLKQERWETQDGSKRERGVIVAEHVEFGPDSLRSRTPAPEKSKKKS